MIAYGKDMPETRFWLRSSLRSSRNSNPMNLKKSGLSGRSTAQFPCGPEAKQTNLWVNAFPLDLRHLSVVAEVEFGLS